MSSRSAVFRWAVGVALTAACSNPNRVSDGTLTVFPTFAGVVTDDRSQAVSGATVVITAGPQTGATATTDGTGRFSFSGRFKGSGTLKITAPGFPDSTFGVAYFASKANPQIAEATLVIKRLGSSSVNVGPSSVTTLAGKVVDALGAVVVGANVQVLTGGPGQAVVTDSGGQFSISGAFQTQVGVRISGNNFATLDRTVSLQNQTTSTASVTLIVSMNDLVQLVQAPYTMTFTVADSCGSAFPDDLRTRTYDASFSLSASTNIYTFRLSGGSATGASPVILSLTASGKTLALGDGFDDVFVVESLGSGRLYQLSSGFNTVTVNAPQPVSVTMPLSGTVTTCQLGSGLTLPSNATCSSAGMMNVSSCPAGKLALTRK